MPTVVHRPTPSDSIQPRSDIAIATDRGTAVLSVARHRVPIAPVNPAVHDRAFLFACFGGPLARGLRSIFTNDEAVAPDGRVPQDPWLQDAPGPIGGTHFPCSLHSSIQRRQSPRYSSVSRNSECVSFGTLFLRCSTSRMRVVGKRPPMRFRSFALIVREALT